MAAKRPKMSKRLEMRRGTWVDPICVECGKRAKLVTGKVAYPHRPGWKDKPFYLCACGAKVGCHPGGHIPLGLPCGPATAEARARLHDVFDPFWRAEVDRGRTRHLARNAAYKWLARELGIRPEACHIGMMNLETATRAKEICYARRDAVANEAYPRPTGDAPPPERKAS